MDSSIIPSIREHQQVIAQIESLSPQIQTIATHMINAIRQNGTLFFMGNGGSAADAQHLSAELIGRFKHERKAIPAIALTTDTSILTALSNDYDYSLIFSRQLEALCKKTDIVFGISTSGNSLNVLEGIKKAKQLGAYTIGLSGNQGGDLARVADECLIVPSASTARIQEAHILIGHILCELLEETFAK